VCCSRRGAQRGQGLTRSPSGCHVHHHLSPYETRHEGACELDPPRRPGPGPVEARFYTEGLGWKVERDYGGSLVGFYGREGLAAKEWGGYGGSFADLDGYIWDIGYSAQGKNQPYAE
jgi:hypothetical protein